MQEEQKTFEEAIVGFQRWESYSNETGMHGVWIHADGRELLTNVGLNGFRAWMHDHDKGNVRTWRERNLKMTECSIDEYLNGWAKQ